MGWASAVVSVYIAEISPVKLRGVFTSLNEIMLTIGIILNFGVGSIEDFPYFHVSLVAVGILALFEATMVWLPDTPRSLLSRGLGDGAERALRLLRGSKYNIDGELTEIRVSILSR
ncbi:Sugar transport protein MST3, partial [Geodia barretti]